MALGFESLTAPASGAFPITPSDSARLWAKSIYVGGNGNLRVTMENGDVVTFVGVLAGTILPIRVEQVHQTGTTATNLIGLT